MTSLASISAATTTPPESFPSSPLTPPQTGDKPQCSRVSWILERVRNCYNGTSNLGCWCESYLSETEYLDLLAAVSREPAPVQGFWRHKLRYDYFPLTSKFVLRMPSLIHEQFIRRVVEEITSQLQNLTSTDPQSSAFAQDIVSSGSTTLDFGSEYGRHDPDGSFRHRRAQYPGVVLEVAYSQEGRELRHLADDYILGSDGNIRAVVGVNIKYSDTKAKSKGRASRRGEAATISVWRPKLSRGCEEGEEDDDDAETLTAHLEEPCVFRDRDGAPNASPQAGLSLRLDDFATTALHHQPMSEPIFIPAATLARFLASAEDADSMVKEKQGAKAALPSSVRKRRRPSTPEEELSEGAEGRYRADEERAEKRARADDATWIR